MSRATPLARWHDRGMWVRETAVYRHLADRLQQLSILTSGGRREHDHNPSPKITILNNAKQQSANLFSLTALWQHRQLLRQADLYKTNQMDGAWTAVLAGMLFRKPVILRMGYLWAKYELDSYGPTRRYRLYRALSNFCFRRATQVVVTTQLMKQQVLDQYDIPADKITIIPNYVDTTLFRPMPNIETVPRRLVFVGRLSAVKNIDLLLKALTLTQNDCHLLLVGPDDDSANFKPLVAELNISAEFIGRQPNEKLPEIINTADIFILPSKFEGHPKALIEAMACGVPVIGTRVPGIEDMLIDGKNGRLCHQDPTDIARVIDEILDNPTQRTQLAQNAHDFAVSSYSLDKIIDLELTLYQKSMKQEV